jgi:hypothetical protein
VVLRPPDALTIVAALIEPKGVWGDLYDAFEVDIEGHAIIVQLGNRES